MQDIESRILIAVDHETTLRADVSSNGQGLLHFRSTSRAILRGVVRWDGDDLGTVHSGIVLEPLQEYAPPGIMNRLGQLAIMYHVLDLKVFIGKQVARRDIRVCHLAGKILTLPLNLQMLLGKCFSGLFPVSRFLLFTRESPLENQASSLLCDSGGDYGPYRRPSR